MGFFGKLFEKKICDFCGGEIGLLGNRKLEDGNMCKTCAAKLSPWFDERRNSTVEQIREQLVYREENKEKVAMFHTTRTLGENMKILFDEDAALFMVTSARNLKDANPDVLNFKDVTGCMLDIKKDTTELMKEGEDGEKVSYQPPRYMNEYDFYIKIHVNHPYFDEIEFKLNSSSVEIEERMGGYRLMNQDTEPLHNMEYRRYKEMGEEIKNTLTKVRETVRNEINQAAMPKTSVICSCCGATTIPDESGCCEYCGSPV